MPPVSPTSPAVDLRAAACEIWRVGVDAVRAETLMRAAVVCGPHVLEICGEPFPLSKLGRIVVVGAGKAGAGMAAALEQILGEGLVDEKVAGWVNVPADCLLPLRRIHLHAARPAGINEPTEAGVQGGERILDLVASLRDVDLCLVLISGGGSALLPAPRPPLTLSDKLAVTRFLSRAGADIHELNTVRKQLSRIKGGGLARALRAGQMRTLVISDVIGSPLDIIASGPTVPNASTALDALEVLRRFAPRRDLLPERVWTTVEKLVDAGAPHEATHPDNRVRTTIIGDNAMALRAAAHRAGALGFRMISLGSDQAGEADEVGRELAEQARAVRDRGHPRPPPACLLSGGEPIVHFQPTQGPRKGGRNQQLALAALCHLWDDGLARIALLSGGTDGEDGPTDAAGAVIDAPLLQKARQLGLDPLSYLDMQNAYPFFEACGGLLKTGPTHTNVMDLRVALIGPPTTQGERGA